MAVGDDGLPAEPNGAPIARPAIGDGGVRPPADGNRGFTAEEMRAAFGPHPMGDWKPVIRRKRRRR